MTALTDLSPGVARPPRYARFLPALAVLMIGCAWLAAAATHGDREESIVLEGKSLERTFEFHVAPGTVGIEVELEASIASGEISGCVTDPRGKERMCLKVERGNGRGSTGKVEALPGIWRLDVSAAGARGRAVARFTSR